MTPTPTPGAGRATMRRRALRAARSRVGRMVPAFAPPPSAPPASEPPEQTAPPEPPPAALLSRARGALSSREPDPAAVLRSLEDFGPRLDGRPEHEVLALSAEADGVRGAAHLLLSDLSRAEAALTRAMAVDSPDIPSIVARIHLAKARKDEQSQSEDQTRLVAATPRSRTEARRQLSELTVTDPAALTSLLERLRALPFTVDEQRVAAVQAIVDDHTRRRRLLEVGRGAPLVRLARRLVRDHPDSLGTVLRAMHSRRAHPEIEQVVRDLRLPDVADWPVTNSRTIARAAWRGGWAHTAATLAERTLAHAAGAPGLGPVREVLAAAEDEILIAEQGWPVDEPQGPPPYEPDPDSVVVVLAQSLPHRSGGYATRSHGIIVGLRDQGWRPLGLTRLGFPYDRWDDRETEVEPEDVVDGVTYRRLLEPGERRYLDVPLAGYIERFAARIRAEAIRERASLIVASSFQNNGLAGLRAARSLGIPFVYDMRGLEDLMKVSRSSVFEKTVRYRYLLELETHVAAHADLTFVITEALGGEMERRGVPRERLAVLPNGVHTRDFQPQPRDEALAAELGVTGKTVIGYAGSLVDYEGLELLMEALAQVRALRGDREDVAAVIVGDGAQEEKVHEVAARLGLEDLVTFTGRVPHSEVSRYLSLFDITPFPRLPLPVCELISPIKPFEAMATGKTAVVSSVAALTEIVQDDVTGLVFDKGDPDSLAGVLNRLVDDPALRERLSQGGLEWVRRERDWGDVTASAAPLLRDLVARYQA